jgi:geranylgeranyl diphosphate synthase type II
MDATARIEQTLEEILTRAESPGSPPRLAAALRYAVFPGGARVRPRLCLAVAHACGDDQPALADAAAASIELLHCSSLVHDDLPCFDDAALRRGKPSVHLAFGEPLAVLAGDALIVMAFECLATAAAAAPLRLPGVLSKIASSVGMPYGIVAGQAWECEPEVDLAKYHREKTGSLFAAATEAGALAAGQSPAAWRRLGECIGEAYQVADDLLDLLGKAADIGKPSGQDAANHRPTACSLGIKGATQRLKGLMQEAMESIPDCPGADDLRAIILAESTRFVPKELVRQAA